ncbi:nicotinamide-nucleotide amidohydrolase family protein [Aurantimonas aggregata]|uniref:Nicotinamide-nucleotide amidohydrolase family protein n=1 Tax=Aurantimonas aggregata TaxID=2047720 RepID=A0A6L9ML07_9HYPH|nr:nicotinamide-nucleotide amidohydrolase family protein [Aurantimonas aggregata]
MNEEATTGRLAAAVIERYAAANLTIATAESCTGGMVAAALTDIAGSSAAFDRGFVTYSNAAKMAMLGVADAALAAHGAVSEEVAREMAEGARRLAGVDVAVSITGIAGPGGGSATKPVGLVHFACAGSAGTLHREERFGDTGRAGIRLASTAVALEMLLDALPDQVAAAGSTVGSP